jgi:hypothetical protein
MESERERYHEAIFLSERLTALNAHAKRAFLLQQIGSALAFVVVSLGMVLALFGKLELAVVQGVGSLAVSAVTYLFYKQSNKANDDTNKFAMISIKFNESWNIIEEAMEHCRYLEGDAQAEMVKKIIEKQTELALSSEVWELRLDAQKATSLNDELS